MENESFRKLGDYGTSPCDSNGNILRDKILGIYFNPEDLKNEDDLKARKSRDATI